MKPAVAWLPWPPKELSPNARVHWATKATKTKNYKNHCAWLMSNNEIIVRFRGQTSFAITFRPPDNRRRDLDNLIASIKPALDALSMIAGVDDSKFRLTFEIGPVSEHGIVEIRVAEANT